MRQAFQNTKKQYKPFIRDRLRHEPEVQRVLIFGSFLHANTPNDIDIAIFQNSQQTYLSLALKYRRLLREIGREIGPDVLPLKSTPEGLFADEIMTGETIYEKWDRKLASLCRWELWVRKGLVGKSFVQSIRRWDGELSCDKASKTRVSCDKSKWVQKQPCGEDSFIILIFPAFRFCWWFLQTATARLYLSPSQCRDAAGRWDHWEMPDCFASPADSDETAPDWRDFPECSGERGESVGPYPNSSGCTRWPHQRGPTPECQMFKEKRIRINLYDCPLDDEVLLDDVNIPPGLLTLPFL